jgi:hypothetical protein
VLSTVPAGERGDRADGVRPVLLGTAYGIWKENRLDQEVWQMIDKAVTAGEPERTPGRESQYGRRYLTTRRPRRLPP